MRLLSIPFRLTGLVLVLELCCLASDANDTVGQALALAKAGKVHPAEALLRAAVADNPDSAVLHGALGKLLFSEQNYPDSVQELNQAEQLDPDSRDYNMLLAAALLGAKRYGVARNFLLAIEPRFNRYAEFHYSLGLAYYNLADGVNSEKELLEAIRLDPTLDRASFVLAADYAADGEFAKAAGILRTLVKAHPANPIYWTALGDALRHMGPENRPEALRDCRKALALAPGNPRTQFVMATIFLDAGDFAEARTLLERLERISPKELEAHVELGRVYARLGKTDLARKESEIVSELRKEQDSGNLEAAPAPGSDHSKQR